MKFSQIRNAQMQATSNKGKLLFIQWKNASAIAYDVVISNIWSFRNYSLFTHKLNHCLNQLIRLPKSTLYLLSSKLFSIYHLWVQVQCCYWNVVQNHMKFFAFKTLFKHIIPPLRIYLWSLQSYHLCMFAYRTNSFEERNFRWVFTMIHHL